jgi:hypothetical protein
MNYQKIYNQIIENAKNRQLTEYKEVHHIVPKCLGGSNKKENLVELTAREHFLCHMLLCEIYPKENKLKHALFLMSIGKQKTKVNQYAIGSRVYERLKNEYSKFLTGKKQTEKTKSKKSESMKKFWASLTEEEKNQIFKKTKQSNTGRKITWNDKIKKSLENRKIEWNLNTSKSITQFDLQGNFIKDWPSIAEAKRWLGSGDIQACVNGKQKQAGGFIWKFKTN